MSSTSLTLTICFLSIYGDAIPTIHLNAFQLAFGSLSEKKKNKNVVLFLAGIPEGEFSSSFHGFSLKGLVHTVYI